MMSHQNIDNEKANGLPIDQATFVNPNELNNLNTSTKKPQPTYTKPSQQSAQAPRSSNPYNNVSNYSHEARTIPPYVISGIANNKRQSYVYEKSNFNQIQDPFIASMNNNWGTFFQTVDNTPAYSEGVLNRDLEALGGLPDLSGSWGGDERLKRYLNNENSGTHDQSVQKKWYHFGLKSRSSNKGDGTRSRSKTGYWMLTEKRDEWGPYLRKMFLFNNYVPLFFRLFIVITTLISLAISAHIYKISKNKVQLVDSNIGEVTQQPSTIMAICVQSIALVYLVYITYDEFSSKPLGIRNPIEKMRLILLDLLFIIFSSANLSLAFNTLYDSRWVCTIDEYSRYPKVETICDNQRTLSAFLFITLIMWVATFSISIMRVIQKVASPGGM